MMMINVPKSNQLSECPYSALAVQSDQRACSACQINGSPSSRAVLPVSGGACKRGHVLAYNGRQTSTNSPQPVLRSPAGGRTVVCRSQWRSMCLPRSLVYAAVCLHIDPAPLIAPLFSICGMGRSWLRQACARIIIGDRWIAPPVHDCAVFTAWRTAGKRWSSVRLSMKLWCMVSKRIKDVPYV